MKVLLAFDGSAGARRALGLVASLEWPAGTAIHAVAVYESTEILVDQLLSVSVDQLEGELAEASKPLAAKGRAVSSAVLVGRPAESLVDEGRRFGADLIVLGSRGRGEIATMLLGSVAAEVVDHAPCPVLVARVERLRTIVLADDDSEHARKGRELVETWPFLRAARVHVVSVAHVPPTFSSGVSPTIHAAAAIARSEMLAEAREQQTRLAERSTQVLQRAGMKAEGRMREGDPAEEILAAARETGADLIVLGTRGRRGLARAVLGSVARNVLVHAPCSVLVVREVSRK